MNSINPPPAAVSRMENPEAALVRGIKEDLGQQQAAEKLTLEKRRAIGAKLFELKRLVGHGRWYELLEEIGLTKVTAWRRMRDFRERDQIFHLEDLEEELARSSRPSSEEPDDGQPTTSSPTDGDTDGVAPAPAAEHSDKDDGAEDQPAAAGDGKPGGNASAANGKDRSDQAEKEIDQAEEPTDPGEAFVQTVERLCKDIQVIVARIEKLKDDPHSYSIHIDEAIGQIKDARQTLWQGRPAHPCPYCKENRDGACTACKGTGRVKKTTQKDGQDAVGGAA